jgi:hypothetical protein
LRGAAALQRRLSFPASPPPCLAPCVQEEEEEEDGEADSSALKNAFEKPSGGGAEDKPPECKQQ